MRSIYQFSPYARCVVSFRETSVDEPAAHALIAEYFAMRAETFPIDLGDYYAAFPAAANFTPPAGVFVVVVEDGEDVGCGGIKRLAPVTEPAPFTELVEVREPAPFTELVEVPGPVAVTELVEVPELVEVRYEVKHLWIQPRMQGRRLGRALLTELERRARAFGATEVVLDTNASLVAADNLYRSSGYDEIEPYNDNPNATHWFRKNLP